MNPLLRLLARSRKRSTPADDDPNVLISRVGIRPEPGDAVELVWMPRTGLPSRFRGSVVARASERITIGALVANSRYDRDPNSLKGSGDAIVLFSRGGALYRFAAARAAVLTAYGISARITVRIPRKVERVERRSYYRIVLEVETVVRRRFDGEARNEPCFIVDLSGGGAMIRLFRPAAINEGFPVLVPIEDGRRAVFVDMAVIACTPVPSARRTEYVLRMRHADDRPSSSREEVREGILRYIALQQRMMLRVRKLTR